MARQATWLALRSVHPSFGGIPALGWVLVVVSEKLSITEDLGRGSGSINMRKEELFLSGIRWFHWFRKETIRPLPDSENKLKNPKKENPKKEIDPSNLDNEWSISIVL